MTYLLALLVALVGAALGFALGAAAAGLLAPVLGITSFEGASGYFAVFIGGPIGGMAGLVLGHCWSCGAPGIAVPRPVAASRSCSWAWSGSPRRAWPRSG